LPAGRLAALGATLGPSPRADRPEGPTDRGRNRIWWRRFHS